MMLGKPYNKVLTLFYPFAITRHHSSTHPDRCCWSEPQATAGSPVEQRGCQNGQHIDGQKPEAVEFLPHTIIPGQA